MVSFFIHAFVSIFAIMNPIGNIPVFLGLAGDQTNMERRKTVLKAVLVAFVILTIFLLLGQFVFKLFGITIDALRIAGGIILFGIGYHLVLAKRTSSHSLHDKEQSEGEDKGDISISPLGTPLIAGPGTIAAVMSLTSSQNNRWMHVGVTFFAFTAVLFITFIVLMLANWIQGKIGHTGLAVITRLMGLILTAIAIEMIVLGVVEAFPIVHRRMAA
ncbi:MarC family protein [Shouchella lonarensis]|uniref:UPF0056 membrane protein n=1 Tax=Shouchella lonarensis TaxID=1464122 RepID=A0A1G6HE37_9BACI|nr:MarC family protein [Shouchella lonarensis]SDB92413.1 multiple antibiotic resistance protein [Shouchella lonarensis]